MPSLPEHYDTIREEFDYDRPDFDLGPLSAALVDRSFAATTDAEAVEAATDEATLFVASAGLTGTPHVGTVAQMFAVKRLEDAGFDTQFLVADYEKYAGSGRDIDVVRDLAADYETFLDRLGYEGRVRTQYDAEDVMHTAFRLAPWFEFDPDLDVDHELTDWEQALDDAYEADQIEHEDATGSTEFAGRLTGLLCLADFMHPSLAEGYDRSVFILGIDEHALDIFNRRYLEETPFDPAFEGLFTRIVPGLDGYPKMSKTIPGSGIRMDMDPARVRELVLEEAASERQGGSGLSQASGLDPAESTVYQMLCLVSEYDGARLADLEEACRQGGAEWEAACEEYADYLAELASLWPEN
jgi:tryptophanyl-tRNA synthetase